MKEIKTVTDDPQFKEASAAVERCQLELLRVADRSSEIESQILGIKETASPDSDQWNRFKTGDSTDTNSRGRIDALRAEQSDLQQREAFLNEALEQGRIELDGIRGRLSLEICKSYRSEFASDAREILNAIKLLCDIEQRSQARREDLTRRGVVTGSLPSTLFNIGLWQDPFGNRVTGYRTWIKENYPETLR